MGLHALKNTDKATNSTTNFNSATSKNALIIFTRNPELGKVKTRLAVTVGDESALNIYKFLLQHTVKITEKLKGDKYVFYSEKIHKQDIWNENSYHKKLQSGNNLGERMENAFNELFTAGYEKVLIIGSDILELQQNDIETAFDTLNENDFVIGPAKDGGYYLLGMKAMKAELFKNKNWGHDTILADTLKDLKEENFIQLPEKNDIDYFGDVKNVTELQHLLPPYLDNKF